MANHLGRLQISAIARAAGVNVETVRFYQRKGLLPKPTRPRGEIAHYTLRDVQRLRFIKAAQRLGFTLAEVVGLLALEDGGHCREVRDLAVLKLDDVRQKLAALRNVESALEQLIAGCGTAQRNQSCHLIASLQANAQD
jgi:MerR family transcriptional regulator, mercuric resistance operon regulatory protein